MFKNNKRAHVHLGYVKESSLFLVISAASVQVLGTVEAGSVYARVSPVYRLTPE